MLNLLEHIYHTGHQIQKDRQMKHCLVCYIGCNYILSQQIKQIHRKTYCDFNIQRCYSSEQKNHFVIQGCKQ